MILRLEQLSFSCRNIVMVSSMWDRGKISVGTAAVDSNIIIGESAAVVYYEN